MDSTRIRPTINIDYEEYQELLENKKRGEDINADDKERDALIKFIQFYTPFHGDKEYKIPESNYILKLEKVGRLILATLKKI